MTNDAEIVWGYRLANGVEGWEVDHGQDGSWIPAILSEGMPAVDLYNGQERDAIRRALNSAGHSDADILRGDFASDNFSEDGVSQPESTPDTD